jgi:hypothetical protein
MHLHPYPVLYKYRPFTPSIITTPNATSKNRFRVAKEKDPHRKNPRLSHYMQAAPSTPITLPLIHSPSCDAKKQTTRAMSMGRPTRWRGDQPAAYWKGG